MTRGLWRKLKDPLQLDLGNLIGISTRNSSSETEAQLKEINPAEAARLPELNKAEAQRDIITISA